jgi:hypothetical protein
MKTRTHYYQAAAIALVAWYSLSTGNVTHADVIFSNITQSFSGALQIQGSFHGPLSQAAAFAPTANYTMTEAQVFVGGASQSPVIDLSLYSDSSGTPGLRLATLQTGLLVPSLQPTISSVSGLTIPLTGGTGYWLVMTPSDPNTIVNWVTAGNPVAPSDFSNSSDGSPPWLTNGGGSAASAQFEIDGTLAPSIPEPGTISLTAMGLGLVALLSAGRRSRERQSR